MVLIVYDLSLSRRKTQWTRLGLKSLVLYKVQATVRCRKKPTVFLSIEGQRLTKPILNHNTYIQAHVIHILATSFIWIVYCFLSAYICFLLSYINCLCYISNIYLSFVLISPRLNQCLCLPTRIPIHSGLATTRQ